MACPVLYYARSAVPGLLCKAMQSSVLWGRACMSLADQTSGHVDARDRQLTDDCAGSSHECCILHYLMSVIVLVSQSTAVPEQRIQVFCRLSKKSACAPSWRNAPSGRPPSSMTAVQAHERMKRVACSKHAESLRRLIHCIIHCEGSLLVSGCLSTGALQEGMMGRLQSRHHCLSPYAPWTSNISLQRCRLHGRVAASQLSCFDSCGSACTVAAGCTCA